MKKIFCASLLLIFFAMSVSCASAGEISKIGFLAKLNVTEDNLSKIINNVWNTSAWSLFSKQHDNTDVDFFDSLTAMQMALDSARIDEMVLPGMTAEYVLAHNSLYKVCCVSKSRYPMCLAMGFRKDDVSLREKFNSALKFLEDSWELAEIQGRYINDNPDGLESVNFQNFEGAKTVKVAVTGDLPPVDFIAPNGKPAGFNTALLAAIASNLKINIELVAIDSGARAAALASGRADVVFWYETAKDFEWNYDAPDGVILSEPYYSWNTFLHLEKK